MDKLNLEYEAMKQQHLTATKQLDDYKVALEQNFEIRLQQEMLAFKERQLRELEAQATTDDKKKEPVWMKSTASQRAVKKN